MNDKISAAGRKQNAANLAKRRALARRYNLTVTDFMPKNIRATLERHAIHDRKIPPELLPKKANGAGESIPLSAIPSRKRPQRAFTEEFKRKAVALLGALTVEQVATKLDIAPSLMYGWQRRYDPTAGLRIQLEQSKMERRARLEQAAMIVEIEGTRGAQLAQSIRALSEALALPRQKKP